MTKLEKIAFDKLTAAVSGMGSVVYEMDRLLEYCKDEKEREDRRKRAMDLFLNHSQDYRLAVEALIEV